MQQRVKKHLEVFCQISLSALILYALLGTRIPALLGKPDLRNLIDIIWYSTGALCLFIVLFLRPTFGLWIILISVLLLGHSYSHLYRPSLATDVPKLDYLFFEVVSSNYCFDIAKTYLENTIVPLLVVIASILVFGDRPLKVLRLITFVLVLALGLNLSVVAAQGYLNLSILSEGSGSALAALRAPGLLEDSGASTVALSSLLIFCLVLVLESRISIHWKSAFGVFWAMVVYLGSFTSGRIYFTLVMLGSLGYGLVKLFQSPPRFRFWIFILLIAIMGSFLFFINISGNFFQGLNGTNAFEGEPGAVKYLALLDPFRAAHIAIFLRSIPEYWPHGIGFGGSHVVLAEYKNFFESKGIVVSGDAPLNFYLGLTNEIGLAFVLFTFGLALKFWDFIRLSRFLDLRPYIYAIAALGLCAGISMMVGTQIIFRSLSMIFMLCVAFFIVLPILIEEKKAVKRPTRQLMPWFISLFLGFSSTLQFRNIPLVPEFLWEKQGYPQSPLGLAVPIEGPSQGKWLSSGVPFVLSEKNHKIFVELPPMYYPLKVNIDVYNVKREKIYNVTHSIQEYVRQRPGKTFRLPIENDRLQACLFKVSPHNYCYVVVDTEPSWILNDLPVGFFLIDDAPQS